MNKIKCSHLQVSDVMTGYALAPVGEYDAVKFVYLTVYVVLANLCTYVHTITEHFAFIYIFSIPYFYINVLYMYILYICIQFIIHIIMYILCGLLFRW